MSTLHVRTFTSFMIHHSFYSDDDDLVPYSMMDDPDSSLPQLPRYLRTLMQALLSDKEPQRMEAALRVAESLIRSKPSDLPEVVNSFLNNHLFFGLVASV